MSGAAMDSWQISLLIAVLLAIAEILSMSFLLLGLAIGMVVVALLQFVGGGLAPARDVLTFAIASFVAVVAFRKIFGKKTDQHKLDQDDINRY
ncbi:MAG: NfeD family protein [Burkholderiaceae bacterium]|jgi:membrane protein implicated in regulation of membrane protease activity